MKTIEIWPKDIEGGDAVAGGVSVTYVRMIDPEDGLEVIAFLRPEALQTLVAQFTAMNAAKGRAN